MTEIEEGAMGYKQIGNNLSFAASGSERIMRKDTKTAMLTEVERGRNKKISKKRYIVEQHFGLSHLHDGAYRARFTTILKNIWDTMCRQACPVQCGAYFTGVAFNMCRGSKLVTT